MQGQVTNPPPDDPPPTIPTDLIGEPNEVNGSVGGVKCTVLVDTGSQVSTVAQKFYESHLSHMQLHDWNNLIRIEGAGGDLIPYCGYIFTQVSIEGVSLVEIPILVVKDTAYNRQTPLLIGTNCLRHMKSEPSAKMPDIVKIARQSVQLVQRHLQKSNGVYGTVYAAESTTVHPRQISVLCGNVRLTVPIAKSVTMVTAPSDATCSYITPCLIDIDNTVRTSYVEVTNCTDTAIQINKGDRIAELHQVTVESNTTPDDVNSNQFLEQFDLTYLESHAAAEEVDEVKQMIVKWQHVFSKNAMDLGKTSVLKHRIDVQDEVPVKEKARRIPPNMVDELRDHIQQLHSMGVIEESTSPWSSPIVLVRKKSGELRMCVDYRKLNSKTIKDAYRIPTIEELIDTLGGAKWFATLDLSSGYHQVMIEDRDKEKTAFTAGPLGFWQYTRMPFGLTNAPALFQRMMERVLSGVHLKTALVYLDDIVVFGETVPELKQRLEEVFRKIHDAGLKLKAKKCTLFQQQLRYLGHIVSNEGVSCDPEMLAPVSNWIVPADVHELQRFIGFANFFRRFIKDFARIAQPLTALMGSSTKKKGKSSTVRKEWIWDKEEQTAFERLKSALTSPPLLAYPDFSKPFIVRTDASKHGLGAVLCQDTGLAAGPQVIAYASRSLKPSEKNYSPYKLEFLALFWAVTAKFQDYLKGSRFTVLTDHNPLTYILTSAKLDATGHRWLAHLSNFNFDIKYKPGRHNNDADALSRMDEETVKAVCTKEEWDGSAQYINMSVSTTVAKNMEVNWGVEQDKDMACRRAKEIIQNSTFVNPRNEERDVLRILRNRKQLMVEGSILFRQANEHERRLVVPPHLRQMLISMCHDDMGHQGRDRTLAILSQRFFWPAMKKTVEEYITSCGRCVRAKHPHLPHQAPLNPISSTEPLEIVCMDYMSLESSKGGYNSVLLITDHFTKFSVAVPTRNQTAATTAKALLNYWIYPYGIPRRLHSDQGANFASKLIKQLCDEHGIQKSRTTPYHPEGDGATERMNRTLLNMLRTLDDVQKQDWKSHLNKVLHAYNTTPHSSTGFSPYFLMFGRKPILPIDALLGTSQPPENHMEEMDRRVQEAQDAAYARNEKARAHQKRNYDIRVRGGTPEVGDSVLVRKLGFTGKHKLEDKWEKDIFKVVDKIDDIPVYKIRRENGQGKVRTLHRNNILPLETPLREPEHLTATPARTKHAKPKPTETAEDYSDSSADSSDETYEIRTRNDSSNIQIQDPVRENSEVDVDDIGIGGNDKQNENLDDEDSGGQIDGEHNEQGSEDSDESSRERNDSEHNNAHNSEVSDELSGEDNDESEGEHDNELDRYATKTPPRRSTRIRRPPDRFGVVISHSQNVELAWQQRVDVLFRLLEFFPQKADDLYDRIIKLIN